MIIAIVAVAVFLLYTSYSLIVNLPPREEGEFDPDDYEWLLDEWKEWRDLGGEG